MVPSWGGKIASHLGGQQRNLLTGAVHGGNSRASPEPVQSQPRARPEQGQGKPRASLEQGQSKARASLEQA